MSDIHPLFGAILDAHKKAAMVASTPVCRVCGSGEWIAVYDPAHPERAICPTCCATATHPDEETGHQFYYERGEGHVCRYCNILRSDTDYDYSEDDWVNP